MELFHLFSVLIAISALFAYVNYRFIKLPGSIGLMLVSLICSAILIATGYAYPALRNAVSTPLSSIDFSELLLEVMLSFMLFAGAIHIRYDDLKSEKTSIILYATVSVVISTVIIGFSSWYILNWLGFDVKLIYAMLFGALISPTDPIAVLSILRRAGISKSLETKIAGESLFNDGVAVVVFLSILELAGPGTEFNAGEMTLLFLREAVGGIILGLAIGYGGYKLLATIDHYQVEVLLTLAMVMGGYTMAHYLHVSGPLAMVAAGLITGNHGKRYGMSAQTADYVDKFWELIDEILNAVLFVLIGLELLILDTNSTMILAGCILILVSLVSRYLSLLLPSVLIRRQAEVTRKTLIILTWGGLRGGISIALALSIPAAYQSNLWVTITYVIVCFSILAQGLTIGKLSANKK